MPSKRTVIFTLSGLWLLSLFFLATTQHPYIWPIRNTLYYYAMKQWWLSVGSPTPTQTGILAGMVQDKSGQPIPQAWVLVSEWDGTTHKAQSDVMGRYQIDSIPSGWYQPAVAAPTYRHRVLGDLYIRAAHTNALTITLTPDEAAPLVPADKLTFGETTPLSCGKPFTSTAQSAEIYFNNAGQPNQKTLFYLPITTTTRPWPLLLTIYPGPVESWGCASIPLAAAGYAVIAVGPAYSFEVEQQVDELERLVNLAQAKAFPQVDGQHIGVLGGSFSSIHVQRLIQRRQDVQAALLLGPPTDMFELRRRFEAGIFKPPFGLDQVMIMGGLPSIEIGRYWQYSFLYHVRRDFPPIALLHSRTDEVVPFQQTELLAAQLAAVGADYETHFFDGASHYLLADGDGQDSLQVYQIALRFLDRHLKSK